MSSWQVQDAKARFSELLEKVLKDGPQVVTRRGIRAAVSGTGGGMGTIATKGSPISEGVALGIYRPH